MFMLSCPIKRSFGFEIWKLVIYHLLMTLEDILSEMWYRSRYANIFLYLIM